MRQPLLKQPTRFVLAILAFSLAGAAYAQSGHSSGMSQTANRGPSDTGEASLAEQLTELRAKVARLEAALEQNHQGQSTAPVAPSHHQGMGHGGGSMPPSGAGMQGGMGMGAGMQGGMGMMGQKSGMGMGGMGTGSAGMPGMSGGSGMMSGMKMGGMGMMGMDAMMDGGMSGMSSGSKQMSGMGMMGMMKGMGGSQGMVMQSALPGFPGASHLYHIGATGFFLDHADHIQLTTEQQSALNQIKEKTALEQATTERKIEEAEQQLWQTTALDRPDTSTIEAKIREIEKLRGDQRLAFIRAVGEAARVLTHEQHLTLTGAHSAPASPADHTSHQP